MDDSAPARPAGASRARHGFALLLAGQTISNLGSAFTLFALPLLVYQRTGSALHLAATSAAEFLPYPLFGLWLGAIADRVDRKRLMIGTDLARAFVIALVPALAMVGHLTLPVVYAVAFLHTTLSIAFNAAQFAAVAQLVPREGLVTANGRLQASYSAASIAAPLAGGAAVAIVSVESLLLVDAASFLLSAVSLALIVQSFDVPGARGPRRSLHRDVADGLRYVLGHPVLRALSAMMALINLLTVTVIAQVVLYASRQLDARPAQIGLLYSAMSAGVVGTSLLAGLLRRRWSFSQVALGALVLDGLSILGLALTHHLGLAFVLLALHGGLGILFNINSSSLRQTIVPPELLGRVISIASVLAWSAIPIGTLIGGAIIARTGRVDLVYGAIGTGVMAIALGFAFSPVGRADEYLPAATATNGKPTPDSPAPRELELSR